MIDAIAEFARERWPLLMIGIADGCMFIDVLNITMAVVDGRLRVVYYPDEYSLVSYAVDELDLADPDMFNHLDKIIGARYEG